MVKIFNFLNTHSKCCSIVKCHLTTVNCHSVTVNNHFKFFYLTKIEASTVGAPILPPSMSTLFLYHLIENSAIICDLAISKYTYPHTNFSSSPSFFFLYYCFLVKNSYPWSPNPWRLSQNAI